MTREPGLYKDLLFEEYDAIDAASNSRLKWFDRSPLHARYHIDSPTLPSPTMKLGQAVHCLTLTPERFDREFLVPPKIDGRTKAGKAMKEDLRAETRTIIDQDDFELAQKLSEKIWSHKNAATLLKETEREVSAVWKDANTKVLCKGRLDAWNPGLGVVLDIKTTQDASPGAFARSLATFGYARQAAFYLDGLTELKQLVSRFVFIVIEKVAPFAVALYVPNKASIEAARAKNEQALKQYQYCLSSGAWPGYVADEQEISLPKWAMNGDGTVSHEEY